MSGQEQQEAGQTSIPTDDTQNASQALQNSLTQIEASVIALPQQFVEGVSNIQAISGLHEQIIANAAVIYPIITTFDPNGTLTPTLTVPNTDLFVVTARQDDSMQAAVLFTPGPAMTFPPGHLTVTKDVLIRGPSANTTRTALEALLGLTEEILGNYWGTYVRMPYAQSTQAGANGGMYYKR